jgi:hypothetical protein
VSDKSPSREIRDYFKDEEVNYENRESRGASPIKSQSVGNLKTSNGIAGYNEINNSG